MGKIFVTGDGRVSAMPNKVSLSFTLNSRGKTAELAMQKSDILIKSIKEKLNKSQLKSNEFVIKRHCITSIYETVENKGKKERVYICESCDVNMTLELLEDITTEMRIRLFDFVHECYLLSNQSIFKKKDEMVFIDINIQYEVKEKEVYNDEALKAAVIKAQKNAETIADAIGKKVVGVESIEYGNSNSGSMRYEGVFRKARNAGVQLESSYHDFSENLSKMDLSEIYFYANVSASFIIED